MTDDAPKPLADEYTATYMDGARARMVTKQRMPGWFFALMGVSMILVAASGLPHGSFVGLLAAIPLLITTLLLSHLRVTVTDDAVHVQYGLWGPTIAMASVRSCVAGRYPALRFGGWGFRRALDGSVAYSVPGGGGECVTLEIEQRGRRRTVVITTPDAAEVARTIEEARARNAGTGVRVDPAPTSEGVAVVDEARDASSTKARGAGG